MILTMVMAYAMLLRVPRSTWRVHDLLHITTALALVLEVVGLAMMKSGYGTIVLYNIFQPLEFILIMGMIAYSRPERRRGIAVGALIGMTAWVWCWSDSGSLDFLLIEGALVMALVLSFTLMNTLWHMANTSALPLAQVPEFWLFLGILVYFGGLMPVVGMIRFVFDEDPKLAGRLWMILPVLCAIRYSLTTLACHVAARKVPTAHGR